MIPSRQDQLVEQVIAYIQAGESARAKHLVQNISQQGNNNVIIENLHISVQGGQVQFQIGDRQVNQTQTYQRDDVEAIRATLQSILRWGSLKPPKRTFPIGWLVGAFFSYTTIGYSLCHFCRTVSPQLMGERLPFLNGFQPTDIAATVVVFMVLSGTLAGALTGTRGVVMLIGLGFAMAWGSGSFYNPIAGVIVLVLAITFAWSWRGAEEVLGAGAFAIAIVAAGCLAGAVWLTHSSEQDLSSLNAVPQWCMALSFGISTFGAIALVRAGDGMGNSLSRFGNKWINFSITYPILVLISILGIILGCQLFPK